MIRDATALRRGDSRSWLQKRRRKVLRMPRPCAVEVHVSYEVKRQLRHQRETPRRKAVASQRVRDFCSSCKRETPRRKAVASQRVRDFCSSCKRETPRRKAVASVSKTSTGV